PTVLGERAAGAMLPLGLAAGAARLFRDLLSADPDDHLLARWQGLDHLILLELLSPRFLPGRRFSDRLAEQVDAWMEGNPQRSSLLYREWIRGTRPSSRAQEVIGSLGIAPADPDGARQMAYLAVLRSIILLERSCGRALAD